MEAEMKASGKVWEVELAGSQVMGARRMYMALSSLSHYMTPHQIGADYVSALKTLMTSFEVKIKALEATK